MLTNVTTRVKDVTIPMVCVILVVVLAGRETTVMKVLFYKIEREVFCLHCFFL